MPATQKAYLEIESGGRIICLFNPAEFSMSKSNQWEADHIPGRSAPDLFFTGGQAGTMSLNLVFDTTADGTAVTAHTNKLLNAMKVDDQLAGHDPDRNKGRPPWVKFHWGDLHSFKAVIEQLELTFTYFSSGGVPLRAKASISLKQFEEDARWGPQNPTSGTPQPHRVHQFHQGDTLDRLAARYYGDSTQWRLIARANAIVDPLAVAPGTLLVIPKPQGAQGA
jgi:hypothetical protein